MDDATKALRDSLVEALAWRELGQECAPLVVASRHNLTLDELEQWVLDDDVWGRVEQLVESMTVSGEAQQMKARAYVREMMPEMKKMFFDDGNTTPAVRKDIFREMAKQAGYGREDDGGEGLARVELLIDLRDGGGAGPEPLVVQSTGRRFPAVMPDRPDG